MLAMINNILISHLTYLQKKIYYEINLHFRAMVLI